MLNNEQTVRLYNAVELEGDEGIVNAEARDNKIYYTIRNIKTKSITECIIHDEKIVDFVLNGIRLKRDVV